MLEQAEGVVATGRHRRGQAGQQLVRGSLKLSPKGKWEQICHPLSLFLTKY